MPTYRFLNTETGEEFEDFVSISRKEELLQNNPHIRQLPSAFAITTMAGSLDSKTDNTWKEVLSKVSEYHPDSALAERYGKRTVNQIKAKDIYNKWKKV